MAGRTLVADWEPPDGSSIDKDLFAAMVLCLDPSATKEEFAAILLNPDDPDPERGAGLLLRACQMATFFHCGHMTHHIEEGQSPEDMTRGIFQQYLLEFAQEEFEEGIDMELGQMNSPDDRVAAAEGQLFLMKIQVVAERINSMMGDEIEAEVLPLADNAHVVVPLELIERLINKSDWR